MVFKASRCNFSNKKYVFKIWRGAAIFRRGAGFARRGAGQYQEGCHPPAPPRDVRPWKELHWDAYVRYCRQFLIGEKPNIVNELESILYY